eukprot:TRINITY_DN1006_c0_g1_i3.p3 TRINITY_DN1006_c0_g1~~TRINITY_DN1006_c0_g1_i3.p3  ORF type:complete len:57 (+),score=3.62 TRINITY_DN1006_c0_g1_i3:629-799(+)
MQYTYKQTHKHIVKICEKFFWVYNASPGLTDCMLVVEYHIFYQTKKYFVGITNFTW